jgi:hypothetical protein
MDSHNVSALCVQSLFHTSEERTKEIDLGVLADLPETLASIREMMSVGSQTMEHIHALEEKLVAMESRLQVTPSIAEAPSFSKQRPVVAAAPP